MQQRGMSVAHEVVTCAATKAMWSMMQQVHDRDILNIGVRVQLFNSIVMSVVQYGCEVWSTSLLKDPSKPTASSPQQVQNLFLRQVGGGWVRKCINTKLQDRKPAVRRSDRMSCIHCTHDVARVCFHTSQY